MDASYPPPSRQEIYKTLQAELTSILADEANMTARLASAACLLSQAFHPRFFWTGFYLRDPLKPDELVIGPYQGTMGCLRIPFGKGVCGAAASRGRTLIVPNVHAFPGHIACDSRSQSEIVVPLFDTTGAVYGVLDIDSTDLNAFDEADAEALEELVAELVV